MKGTDRRGEVRETVGLDHVGPSRAFIIALAVTLR